MMDSQKVLIGLIEESANYSLQNWAKSSFIWLLSLELVLQY